MNPAKSKKGTFFAIADELVKANNLAEFAVSHSVVRHPNERFFFFALCAVHQSVEKHVHGSFFLQISFDWTVGPASFLSRALCRIFCMMMSARCLWVRMPWQIQEVTNLRFANLIQMSFEVALCCFRHGLGPNGQCFCDVNLLLIHWCPHPWNSSRLVEHQTFQPAIVTALNGLRPFHCAVLFGPVCCWPCPSTSFYFSLRWAENWTSGTLTFDVFSFWHLVSCFLVS